MKFPRASSPLFAVVLAIAAVAAYAEPPDPVAARVSAPEWTKADSNRDGFLTKDELISYPTIGQDFARIDSDGDGRLSQAEYTSWMDLDHDDC